MSVEWWIVVVLVVVSILMVGWVVVEAITDIVTEGVVRGMKRWNQPKR